MAVAAILTAGFSLAIAAGFGLTALSVERAVHKIPQQFDMAVYLKLDTSEEQVKALQERLEGMPKVASVNFVDRETAWKQFKKDLSMEISEEDVPDNPLPDTFWLKVADPEASAALQKELADMKEVDSVLWRQSEVEFFQGLARIVAIVGTAVTLLLFVGSAFIIGNTIRLGIYARRREVAIMRMVGATPGFIRFPFLLEGMLLAGAGAVLATILIRVASGYISNLAGSFQALTRYFGSGVEPFEMAVVLLAAGLGLGALASHLSIRRYLREVTLEVARR